MTAGPHYKICLARGTNHFVILDQDHDILLFPAMSVVYFFVQICILQSLIYGISILRRQCGWNITYFSIVWTEYFQTSWSRIYILDVQSRPFYPSFLCSLSARLPFCHGKCHFVPHFNLRLSFCKYHLLLSTRCHR